MDIASLRKDYSLKQLREKDVLKNPILQFEKWLQEAIDVQAQEPTAMTLSTVGKDGKPSSRVVLLKGIERDGFLFFTNYESKKAKQIDENPFVALNFVWHELERQIRIEGKIEKLVSEKSNDYFNSRPEQSKISASVSPQSQVVPNRNYLENLVKQFEKKNIRRPINWGGYIVKPNLIEFWQGRSNRLHDRICYTKTKNETWKIERLAP